MNVSWPNKIRTYGEKGKQLPVEKEKMQMDKTYAVEARQQLNKTCPDMEPTRKEKIKNTWCQSWDTPVIGWGRYFQLDHFGGRLEGC